MISFHEKLSMKQKLEKLEEMLDIADAKWKEVEAAKEKERTTTLEWIAIYGFCEQLSDEIESEIALAKERRKS